MGSTGSYGTFLFQESTTASQLEKFKMAALHSIIPSNRSFVSYL